MGNNKVIKVVSNEFDGALVGEFSIRDLPAAVKSFLSSNERSSLMEAAAGSAERGTLGAATTVCAGGAMTTVAGGLRGRRYLRSQRNLGLIRILGFLMQIEFADQRQ